MSEKDKVDSGGVIEKAESTRKTPVASLRGEVGRPRIITSAYFVNESKKKELQMPYSLSTYDCMYEDEAVYSSIDFTNIKVTSALNHGEFEGKRGSALSKAAAEFLNYNIRNMEYGTWLEHLNNACTDLQYGWSFSNLVLGRRKAGQYKGSLCISKLAPRDQKTLYAWLWDAEGREIIGFVQKPTLRSQLGVVPGYLGDGLNITQLAGNYYKLDSVSYPILRNHQLLHYKHNPTNNNPQGDSPLNHCYKAWKEKWLIEQHELVGIQKGYGGMLVLRVPSKLIEEANDPDTYADSYAEYISLQEDAAKFNSGEGAFIVLTSDTYEGGNTPQFNVELLGEKSSNIQSGLGAIIDQKKKAIYNCFGTGFLILGDNGVGSNALHDGRASTHDLYVQRIVDAKVDVINTQLIPRLLAANDIYLDWKDMPTFRPAEADELDLEVLGKFLQRAGSVNKITPAWVEDLAKKAKLPIEGIEDLDYTDKGDSRAGESKGSSGTGNTQQGGKGSAVNSANKALNLKLVDEYGDQQVFEDQETKELIFIDKEQQ